MLIYIITNRVNGKVYIGQTIKTLEERKKQHYSSYLSKVNTHLYNAMNKYGWDNFEFQQIASASSQEELDQLEDMYIQQYDSIKNGYNMIRGGRSNPMDSEEVRRKHDRKMKSLEVRKKIGQTVHNQIAAQGGRSAEYRKKLSEEKKAMYSSERGEIARQKFRKSFKFSPEHFKALNDAKNKKVYCIDLQGNTIAEFDRVKDGAQWWYDHGYVVKGLDQLCDKIKESYKFDKYIKGIKWIYRV